MPAFRHDPRAAVVAIAASTRERAARVAERLEIPHAYADWRDLVADPQVDLVSIAVPPALQPEIAVAAARAGKPVLCEKPVATDIASAKMALGAVQGAGVAHGVDLELAELPVWQEMKRLCAQRAFGRPREATLSWSVRTRSRPADSWKERTTMGGALGGFASHAVYLIELCLGPITRLSSRLDDRGGQKHVQAWLVCVEGCRVSLSIATESPRPAGLRFDIQCEDGAIALETSDPLAVQEFRLRGARRGGTFKPMPFPELVDPNEDARVVPVARLVARLLDAVQGGPAMRPDLNDGVRVQLLLDAVVAAGRSREWIAT